MSAGGRQVFHLNGLAWNISFFPSEIGFGRTGLLTCASTNLGNLPRDSFPSGCSHLPAQFSAFTVTG
jgi:hypothetical protein